jgi:hypothetical protein
LALGWIGIPGYSSLLGFPITSGIRVLYLAMDRPDMPPDHSAAW